ncbi:hypothetical protein [Maribellus sp. YY47]|uniref:hypothetical protein n=1 Tax=Maribellus sp. YY47 TaxID=2929486 RepID=UPI0020007909|nr:hypothetical protein [Maribellus sp. YY47]MCK3684473.1 hypothetical protein [Maribellus sp. YY47]
MNIFRIYKSIIYFAIATTTLFIACDRDNDDDIPVIEEDVYTPVEMTPVSGLRIAWDYSSMQQLAEKGNTPEMIRLSDSSLVMVYASEGSIYQKKSWNNGLSWDNPSVLFPKSTHKGIDGDYDLTYTDLMVQPTIILLSDGDLLAACGVRYSYTVSDTEINFPASILVRRISGNGTVMEPVQEVYSNLGCEYPDFLELPSGVVQLYFSNGSSSVNIEMMSSTALVVETIAQRIEMLSSEDGGETWSSSLEEYGPDGIYSAWTGSKVIASRLNKNNNCPAASIVNNNIVVAFGDNNTVTYKPYIVRSTVADNWSYAITGDTPDRDYALYEILPEKYNMGVPDLISLPQGESVLSYETDAGRTSDKKIMEVAISNENAMDFKHRTRPFPFTQDVEAIGNSLLNFNDSSVVALTSSDFQNNEVLAPWMIKGYLIDELTINKREIEDHPIFVGGQSDANIRVGLGIDENNLYFEVIANDQTPVSAETGTESGDGIYLYIDAANRSLLDVDTGISKFWISSTGEVLRWDGKEGVWIVASSDGIDVIETTTDSGYKLAITLPKNKLVNFSTSVIRFGVGLTDYVTPEQGKTELLALCEDMRSSTWLKVTF